MKKIHLFAALFLSVQLAAAPAMAGGVVASIKPLHSLVAAVMAGDNQTPMLLVDGKQSLHSFTLKPSQVKAMQHADVVFYMGGQFEGFMEKTLASLPENVLRAPLGESSDLSRIRVRTKEGFESDVEDNGKAPLDMHLWLSPVNAKVMVMEIARQLAIAYPDNRNTYYTNARKLSERLNQLDRSLEPRMFKLSTKPFVVFHDAYQYFDGRYGLRIVGAFTVHPERALSAKRVSQLRGLIKESGAVCVFREPQFDSKVVDALVQDTKVKTGVLDPEGALLTPGPELYFQLIEGIASGLEKCLNA